MEEYKNITDNMLQMCIKGVRLYRKRVVNKDGDKESVQYYNCPCAFDIETTSFVENGDKRAIMYIWQCDINGLVFYGRTWDEYEELIERLHRLYELGSHKKLVIYVHNLAYEFQFMKDRFEWQRVFARKKRRPIYVDDGGIEYRCSYYLSGFSLEKVAKNLHSHEIAKLVGDLDYSKKRHSKTKMTEEELGYCENDVVIIEYYISELIEKCGNITKIPLTQTGFIRQLIKQEAFQNFKQEQEYVSKQCQIDVDNYYRARDAYRGGFTHANAYKVGRTLHNVGSFDFASDYPAVMFVETYPMGKPRDVKPSDYDFALEKFHCLLDVEILGLTSTFWNEHILSFSKCAKCYGEILDNGRVVQAEYVAITITEIEWKLLKHFYDFVDYRILHITAYSKGFLPKYMLYNIAHLFTQKTLLKGLKGSEAEYMHSKQLINSMYGMCVTDIVNDEIDYNGNICEWVENPVIVKETIDKYNNNQYRYLFYLWGIYVTAYAQRNLLEAIYTIGDDYVYSDTDSIKCENYENHRPFFQRYNEYIKVRNRKVCDRIGIPYDMVEPVDKHGNKHYLGIWEEETPYDTFKTLGAKRYIYVQGGILGITIAGVNKRNGAKYLTERYGVEKAVEMFNHDMVFPAKNIDKNGMEYSPAGKLVLTYFDEPISGELVDYNGIKYHYEEMSYVHSGNASYCLNMGEAYLEYLQTMEVIDGN